MRVRLSYSSMNKHMEKKKKKVKVNWQLLKEYGLKTLHILGYVAMGICIILAIAMSVNSCASKKNKTNAIRNTENDISEKIALDLPSSYQYYWSKNVGVVTGSGYRTFTLDFASQLDLMTLCETGFTPLTKYVGEQDDAIYTFDTKGYVIATSNDYYSFDSASVVFRSYDTGELAPIPGITQNYYQYRFFGFRLRMKNVNGNNVWYTPIRNFASDTSYNNYRAYYGSANDNTLPAPYNNYLRQLLVYPLNTQVPNAVLYFYENYDRSNSYDLTAFNPNGLYGFTADNVVFISGDISPNVGNDTYEYALLNSSGFFISNGKYFEKCFLYFKKLPTNGVYADNSSSTGFSYVDGRSLWYFDHMDYVNTITNDSYRVCYRSTSVFGGQAGPNYTIVWNDYGAYKQIYFYALTDLSATAFEEKMQLLGNITGHTGFDGFTILTSAFSSLLPIFNMTLIPGITIGTLLVIPLIATVIFAIIKIMHK